MALGRWDQMRAGLVAEARLRKQLGPHMTEQAWTPAVAALHEVPVFHRLDAIRSWLQSVKVDAADGVLVCEALIEHVVYFRDQELQTPQERRDFVEYARTIWPGVVRIMLARIERARASGRDGDVRKQELKLLSWAEQLENRVLVEEVGLTWENAGREGAHESADELSEGWEAKWQPGQWGFAAPWDEHLLSDWSEAAIAQWLDERQARYGGRRNPSEVVQPLRASGRSTEERPHAPAAGVDWKPAAASASGEENWIPRPLEELVPERAVWIRALFDDSGRLYWWGWMKSDGELFRLAFGQSSAGARERLGEANRRFAHRTDAAWSSFRAASSGDAMLGALHALTEAMRDPESFVGSVLTNAEYRDAFHEGISTELQELERDQPALAEHGRRMLEWLVNERGDAASFPQDAWRQWSATAQERRQSELEAASREQVGALAAELDLWELSMASPADLRWEEANIVFQVNGPLLAMPLAWLKLRGAAIFEQAASTSTVVSLALRRASLSRCGSAVRPETRLLSAQWFTDDDRNRLSGAPCLHAGLHYLAGRFGWECWSLGDQPPASIAQLNGALRKRFGLVVVVAHGLYEEQRFGIRRTGVELANGELWDGQQADLGDLDLLVLTCCTVGRLDQRADRDVEGLYARLAARGARCVVAARWPIADWEAALFMVEFVKAYLEQCQRTGVVGEFDRAKAFNHARRRVLRQDSFLQVSAHCAMAFEMYGLG